MSTLEKLKKPYILFPLLLILIEVILFALNYKPGTFLVGWDNIMPEFNLKLNFDRSFFSIWQEYRGLGVLDGLSHAANFFHTIYIWILSLFLPESAVRYVYIHLTHMVGGVAFFFLLRKFTKNDVASFLGSLFYMFNIGVVQMYFAPLEVFATHFTALPLVALFAINALEKTNNRNLLFLFLACLLTTQQGFVPTIFTAFSIMFFFILLINVLRTHQIKSTFIVLLVVFAANAFWGVPYIYSAIHTSENIANSRINQFSSEEIFYRNQSFGDIKSVATLNGFMIDTIELNPTNFTNEYFMNTWRNLTKNPIYIAIYISFLSTAIFGIFYSLKKKNGQTLPFLLTLLTAFVFLANDTLFFKQINELIRSGFPLLGEAFRFPFTKFITLFAFCLSIFLTIGLSAILVKFKKYQIILAVLIFIGLAFTSYPAFRGYFTSPFLKLKLPTNYEKLFTEMQGLKSDGRVALLPAQTFWNWQYRDWGQRGSGFIWYGLPQPVTERAFDPWSPQDEQFYNELAFAVSNQDQTLFQNVIEKYDIKYLLLDKSTLNTLSRKEINYDSLEKFLEKDPNISKKSQYGKLVLYEINKPVSTIYSLNTKSTKGVYPNYNFEKEDGIYSLTGNYITDTKDPNVLNLFPSLYSEKTQGDLEFNFQNKTSEYILSPKNKIPYDLSNYSLRIPSLFQAEFLVPVEVSLEDSNLILTPAYPEIIINGNALNIEEEPIILPISIADPTLALFLETKQNIYFDRDGNKIAYLLNPAENTIEVRNEEGEAEKIYLDTSELTREATYTSLPENKINTVQIVFPKSKTTISQRDIIKNKNFKLIKNDSGKFASSYSAAESKVSGNQITLEAVDGSSELSFYAPDLYHQGNYIMFAKSDYVSGLPMRFYVDNDTENKAEIESIFPKKDTEIALVIPKSNNYFKGYGFHFIEKSVGKEKASGKISNIEIYPFPAKFIRGLQIIDIETLANQNNSNPKIKTEYRKANTAFYQTYTKPGEYIVLSQAIDPGWAAYEVNSSNQSPTTINGLQETLPFLSGNKLQEKKLINNWANGWKTEKGGSTVIVYLPSYLQYLGQAITIGALLLLSILVITHRKHHKND
ncbi:MAG: hypothetical protein E6Q53_02525 [Candidatus Moraniibacteriota bacterium]|nr:MAG: hypothetical protein E6Q53_02525 [Candidatus Moranbacteria bacterium]